MGFSQLCFVVCTMRSTRFAKLCGRYSLPVLLREFAALSAAPVFSNDFTDCLRVLSAKPPVSFAVLVVFAKCHAPDSDGQAFAFWMNANQQLVRHEVFFRRQRHKIAFVVAAAHAPWHHMMTLDIPDNLSVSGTLDQCVVVPLVVHVKYFRIVHHLLTTGSGFTLAVRLAGRRCTRLMASNIGSSWSS